MNWSALLLALLPLAWLLPNHHLPWTSAWQEGTALVVLAAAALTARPALVVPRPVLALVALGAASVGLQWALGPLVFAGDAVVSLLYLGAFLVAAALGTGVGAAAREAPAAQGTLDAVGTGVALAAIASVGIAVVQWLGLPLLGLWGGSALAPGARPSGNVGQPNLLCSVAFLGVCAVALLRERGRIGAAGQWAAWLFLAAGMAATGSRTAWLQAGVLLAGSVLLRRRAASRIRPRAVALWVASLLALQTIWPHANEWLLLSASRTAAELSASGGRLPYWMQMLDAVARHPLAGYGWQQATAAQLETALEHPLRHGVFEQSHNLLLEFVLWAGLPVGLALGGLVAAIFVLGYRRCRDGAAAALLAGAAGVVAHSLVEYPLHFAYLLLPVGVFIGAAHGLSAGAAGLRLNTTGARVGALAFAVVLGVVVRDYLVAEENERVLLLEAAHIGTFGIESPAPDLYVLTQLAAFLRAARVEPQAGMSAPALDELRQVATRFAYAPAMSRYAVAAALNGQPLEAEQTMHRLCAVHRPHRCRAALDQWDEARIRHRTLPALDRARWEQPAAPRGGG